MITPDFLLTPLQYLKGVGPRRAADLMREGLRTVDDLLCRSADPLRGSQRSGTHCGPDAGAPGVGLGTGAELPAPHDPAARLPDLRGAHPRRAAGCDPRGVAQPAVPAGRAATGTSRSCCSARSRRARRRPAVHQSGLRAHRSRRGDAETMHTGRIVPGVREDRRSVTPKMQRRLVHDALTRLPTELDDPLPDGPARRLGLPGRRHGARARRTSRRPARRLDTLNAFRTPAQLRLIFEEFFLFQVGPAAAAAGEPTPSASPSSFAWTIACAKRPGRVLPFKLTAGQRAALKEIVDDMQRPQPDEPAAAGRRRRGQDDRGAAGGAGGDGERPAGRVHGAHRDPGRAALRDDRGGCSQRIAVPRRRC